MCALELGAVATSNSRWQQHCQMRCLQLKPSPILMDPISAIFVRHQTAHKTSLSNAMRKEVAIKFKAIRQSCQQTWLGCFDGFVSITTILIPQQPQQTQAWDTLNRKPQLDQANSASPQSPSTNNKTELASNNKKQSRHDTYALRHAHDNWVAWQSQWHCP